MNEEEFIGSYQWISASIENDDYFELMIHNAWHEFNIALDSLFTA